MQMFPRYVYQSSNGKTTSWFIVNNEDDQVQAIKDGWSLDIPTALEGYNHPNIPKKRGRPPKVLK